MQRKASPYEHENRGRHFYFCEKNLYQINIFRKLTGCIDIFVNLWGRKFFWKCKRYVWTDLKKDFPYRPNYRLQTKLREGNVFTHVCHSVHTGSSAILPWHQTLHWDQTPLGPDFPSAPKGHGTRQEVTSYVARNHKPQKWAVRFQLECFLVRK